MSIPTPKRYTEKNKQNNINFILNTITMNKTSKLFAGFAALALFAACSSDEPMGNNPEGPVTPVEGQKAYLNVKINSAN